MGGEKLDKAQKIGLNHYPYILGQALRDLMGCTDYDIKDGKLILNEVNINVNYLLEKYNCKTAAELNRAIGRDWHSQKHSPKLTKKDPFD